MRQGPELVKWASEKAAAAAGADTGLLIGARWENVTLAIAEAYLHGANDALKDEIDRHAKA